MLIFDKHIGTHLTQSLKAPTTAILASYFNYIILLVIYNDMESWRRKVAHPVWMCHLWY